MEIERLAATEENGLLVGTFLAQTFAQEHRFGTQAATGINTDRAWQHIWEMFTDGAVWIARDDDGTAGSISVCRKELWWTDRPYLGDGWLYVRPEKRGFSTAMRLLDQADAYASELGLPLVINVLNSGKPELVGKFLNRFGFTTLGGTYIKER
ncbi:hypothetical protein J1C56_02120 [Aminobacter anthyllidis]|uniref:N-acetyltransferase domain-containing protein n=1 Tax=Aminobacter anthyllidis TaxID=1035067 RepID=A0A9X1D3Z0_9HYPH|nr:GNAT family N-acetyltransferase [Aminobacter anthyllidis]MBT1154381.1 hypothetical protein [Aminobacter anthyllidis]